ncbi:hypothetical protein ABEB36_011445 [Hypothenemus hampei]|uniref:Ionotropic glutamate receptor C-terminal domain-containing protein n=1 Tax=Hypothenemus hampei TaxID=57062 RepID=A0ABD1EG30_HYPHA
MLMKLTVTIFPLIIFNQILGNVEKRALQKSHEKSRIEKLSKTFLENKVSYSKVPNMSLISLLNTIANDYLLDCTTVILYEESTKEEDYVFLKNFLQSYPHIHVHGSISIDYSLQLTNITNEKDTTCVHFIIFLKDLMKFQNFERKRNEKVVLIAKSTKWRVREYLQSEYSQKIANLLVIVKSGKLDWKVEEEESYTLYTHKLFSDALGSSLPVVIASWFGENFSKNVTLFQKKFIQGFSGHRFIITTASQPPYVIKKQKNQNDEYEYTGIEVKLISLLAQMYNFSTDFKEANDVKTLGSNEAVIEAMKMRSINLGIGGVYITENRYNSLKFLWHNEDCASFISLASTSLPRYKAIMGPFRWTVWLALIAIYLGSIPIFSYSDKLSFKYLLKHPSEIENMFWYVFGTFTNCFTFKSKSSWTNAQRNTTKLLIGVYWVFTIIITACYTGSIIAFVTLPVYPSVIDTVSQLLEEGYDIGMLNKGGWPSWFNNLTDESSNKLLQKVDYVSDVESGLKNVTKAFFWPYAFLGSREELKYIVKTNFSLEDRKSLLHISQDCFVTFKVAIVLPMYTVYGEMFENGLQKILQSGLNIKIKSDIEWEMMRSEVGKLLAANSMSGNLKLTSGEDRALTLTDTQGMFLLLGTGFTLGFLVLLTEVFGNCFRFCKKHKKSTSSASSIASNPRFHERQTF